MKKIIRLLSFMYIISMSFKIYSSDVRYKDLLTPSQFDTQGKGPFLLKARFPTQEDEPFISATFSGEEMDRYADQTFSIEEQLDNTNDLLESTQEDSGLFRRVFVLEVSAGEQDEWTPMGIVIFGAAYAPKQAQLMYLLHPAFRGQGYGAALLNKIISLATMIRKYGERDLYEEYRKFGEDNDAPLETLFAQVRVDNAASMKLLCATNFTAFNPDTFFKKFSDTPKEKERAISNIRTMLELDEDDDRLSFEDLLDFQKTYLEFVEKTEHPFDAWISLKPQAGLHYRLEKNGRSSTGHITKEGLFKLDMEFEVTI